ncbi:MAG: DUF6311 domain-containing protein [Cyanobacteria bacterium P01_A01_bin.3]
MKPSGQRNSLILAVASILIGSFFSFSVFKSAIVPTNIDWLLGRIDPSQHHLGWLLYKNDPNWQFPLTITKSILYPTGLSIAYTDSIPIIALPLKAFSQALKLFGINVIDFQYFGIVLCINIILQLFFSMKAIELYKKEYGLLIVITGGCLLALMPSVLRRGFAHIALTSHWILICSLWLYLKQSPRESWQEVLKPQILLTAIAAGVHPYIAVMSSFLGMTTCIKFTLLRKKRRHNYRDSLLGITAILLTLIASWYFFGYFSQGSSAFSGVPFGRYSMNLLSPINSMGFSMVLPQLPTATDGQYEGFNYLGLGTLLLAASALALKPKLCIETIWRKERPLFIACALLSLFAISTKVTFGSLRLITIGVPDNIGDFLSTFHSSGRMFWPVSYMISATFISIAIKSYPRRVLHFILPLLLIIQYVDLSPLLHSLTQRLETGRVSTTVALSGPEWQDLSASHRKLIVTPSHQCDREQTPTGSFLPFAELAATQNLSINTFKPARMGDDIRTIHCKNFQEDVLSGKWDADAAYVFSNELYQQIYPQVHRVNTHECSQVDNLTLCKRTGSSVTPTSVNHP